MTYAATCEQCGEHVRVRSHRAAVFTCTSCGGACELLDANAARGTSAPLGARSAVQRFVAMDGTIVKAQQNGDDARCTSPKCGRTSRTCAHVLEAVATLRAGAEQP